MLIFVGLLFNSCGGGGNISLVKGGILDLDKSLTVGEAFENYKYFKKVKWDNFKSDDKRDMVEVMAEYDIEKAMKTEKLKMLKSVFDKFEKVTVAFQFIINKDNTFNASWYGVTFYAKNGGKKEDNLTSESETINALKGIYDNDPDL